MIRKIKESFAPTFNTLRRDILFEFIMLVLIQIFVSLRNVFGTEVKINWKKYNLFIIIIENGIYNEFLYKLLLRSFSLESVFVNWATRPRILWRRIIFSEMYLKNEPTQTIILNKKLKYIQRNKYFVKNILSLFQWN